MDPIGKDFLGLQTAGRSALDAARTQNELAQLRAVQEQQKSGKIGTLGRPAGPDGNPQKVEQAAAQFEALLLHQMFQAMWSTVPDGGILSGSKEEQYYRDMFTQGLADTISQGQGIGIKQVVAKELYKQSSSSNAKK